MKLIETNKFVTSLLALALIGCVTGCREDLYDPEAAAGKLPPKDNYFDFKLTGNVQLSVNYDLPGLETIIEVYDQNPMKDHKTKKEGITPIYVAYTNGGKYEGVMNIPTAVTEAYVYTNSISAPKCVKLNAVEHGFKYDAAEGDLSTRAIASMGEVVGLLDYSKLPYEVASVQGGKRPDNLFSITAWNPSGWELLDKNYYKRLWNLGAENEEIGVVSGRITAYLNAQREIDNNKSLLRNPEQINMKVPATAKDGMTVEVTHMGEQCSFFNTFGYYYYEDRGTTLTPEEFWKIKKYIIIPKAKTHVWGGGTVGGAVVVGETVKLLYFDEDGNKSEKFPANYVIGWFLIANGFGSNPPIVGEGGYSNGGVIKNLPADAYTSAAKYSAGRYTCMSDDQGADRRFISLYDAKSKLRVIGIEDYVLGNQQPDDYMDLMFVVKTTPDLGGGELPPIDPENPEPDPAVWPVKGTLAFEDIWPNGGDYDLNDVIVEYNRDITIDRNNIVTKITETFKPVQKEGSARQDNYFACQYKKTGKVTLPEGVTLESNTNSIVVEASAKAIAGNTYVVERDLSGLNMSQTEVKEDFNPYLIAKEYFTTNRVEVHLPMQDMTSAADSKLMNDDNAYYIGAGGIFPFAINIPINGFIPVDETKRIDSEGQYPSFAKWATSKGADCKDWYMQDKGKK